MFGLCPIEKGSQLDLRRETSAEITLCVYALVAGERPARAENYYFRLA
jgi:hypothetical protein